MGTDQIVYCESEHICKYEYWGYCPGVPFGQWTGGIKLHRSCCILGHVSVLISMFPAYPEVIIFLSTIHGSVCNTPFPWAPNCHQLAFCFKYFRYVPVFPFFFTYPYSIPILLGGKSVRQRGLRNLVRRKGMLVISPPE